MYLNLHVLWVKVEWIDLTFMPCKYFGTSLKKSIIGRYYDLMILSSALCPIRSNDSTQWIMKMCARVDVFFLCVTETVLIWLEVNAKNDKISAFM